MCPNARCIKSMLRFPLVRALAVWGLVSISLFAADEFPNKPVRIIVPFGPGSGSDVRTRQLVPLLSQRLKQPIIVDNRPGAAGSIGTQLAARSSPDGYTVTYILIGTVCINPHLDQQTAFNPLRDLVPLIVTMRTALIMAVKADSPIRSVQDLIKQAKANPDRFNYGTSGPGSVQHLIGEQFKKKAGVEMLAIPYKGGDGTTLADLMGGQIDIAFASPLTTMPLVEGGKLRALAVTSAKRLANLPNVPTIAESGVPGYDETVWSGYAVPAGTPDAIVKKLHSAFQSAMLSPEFREDITQSGAELIASSQQYAAQLLKADYERYGKIVKDLGLKAD